MTNYEWLLQMGGEERQIWFDAPHVDDNDALTRKSGVRAANVDANDASVNLGSEPSTSEVFDGRGSEVDSREKLEADVRWQMGHFFAWDETREEFVGYVLEWLDRQAAITRREVLTQPDERDEQIAELAERVGELTAECGELTAECGELTAECDALKAECDALADDLRDCNRERESLRRTLGVAIDHAHDILQLIDEGMA